MSPKEAEAPYSIVSVQESEQLGPGYTPQVRTLVIYRTQAGDYDQLLLPKREASLEEIHTAIKERLGIK